MARGTIANHETYTRWSPLANGGESGSTYTPENTVWCLADVSSVSPSSEQTAPTGFVVPWSAVYTAY